MTLPLPLLSSLNRKQEASLSVTMNFFSALVLTLAPWRPTTAIPAIFQGTGFTAAGGLMSYGSRLTELYHQVGAYSGLVLAGAAPAELPIYQSSAVEMIVNLRSAKSLGIGLPQAIVDQATTLIR